MRSNVGFPLKVKIILFITTLSLGSLATYAFFAMDLFQRDKTAYVYEASLNGLEQVSSRLIETIDSTERHFHVINRIQSELSLSSTERQTLLSQYFMDNPSILSYLRLGPEGQRVIKSSISNELKELLAVNEQIFIDTALLALSEGLQFQGQGPIYRLNLLNEKFEEIPSHLIVINEAYDIDTSNETIEVLLYNLDPIIHSLINQRVFDYYLVDQTQSQDFVRLSENHNFTQNQQKAIIEHTSKQVTSNQELGAQVQERTLPFEQEEVLLGTQNIAETNLKILSIISRQKAFAASEFLAKQTIYFALLLLSIAVILGIFFSKSITKQLESLYQATLKIAEGDFETKLELKSNDEIGSLSKSFNFMSDEILKYMKEMKEKHRLENELAIAKLVQETFIPPQEVKTNHLELSTYYEPATECGGDWWGYIERENKTVFILADATGHGVPAAFLTATVSSCIKTIQLLSKENSSLVQSPEQIMGLLNKNIAHLKGEILLTCFIGVFDHKNNILSYTNASHMEPLILRPPKSQRPSKDHFIPLLDGKGPRIGHKEEAVFEQGQFHLEKDDVMILWTDGITEATNNENQQWGQRKFLKSILSSPLTSAKNIKENILKELNEFTKEVKPEDDMTLIVLKKR